MLRGRCPRQKLYSKYCPPVRRSQCNCYTVRCLFFFYQSAAGENCAALTDIVNSCNLLHKRRRRKFPLRHFQFFCRKGPVLPAILFHQLQNSRLLRFQINTCRLSNCFWRNPGRRKCRKNLSSIRPAGVFFLQPMPTVITFGIR